MIWFNFSFVYDCDLITAIPVISSFKLLIIIGHQEYNLLLFDRKLLSTKQQSVRRNCVINQSIPKYNAELN